MKLGLIHHQNQQKDQIRDLIHQRTDYDVIWGTNYGFHALELCDSQQPDLILLDVNVMEYDGIQFVSDLISQLKCPILLVTDNMEKSSYWVFEAMSHGALDVAEFKKGNEATLIRKIQQMALVVNDQASAMSSRKQSNNPEKELEPNQLIIFGASTGGPLALASILSSFPSDLKASVVIIQHIDEKFSNGFANWLKQRTLLPVQIVQKEIRPMPGNIYISDSKWHLVMTPSKTLNYSSRACANVYKPSVDVFFESVAKNWESPCTAILLTGMGSDGAQGLKQLREKGWKTIAEAESSCVVFGMPKAAIELKAASEVLDLHEIPFAVLSHLRLNYQRNHHDAH